MRDWKPNDVFIRCHVCGHGKPSDEIVHKHYVMTPFGSELRAICSSCKSNNRQKHYYNFN